MATTATMRPIWQTLYHSTTFNFSPECREEIFTEFRSSSTFGSVSLGYDPDENWFELRCLSSMSNDAAKHLSLILSAYSSENSEKATSKTTAFVESLVDWQGYWDEYDETQRELEAQKPGTEEILIDFGQRSGQQFWTPSNVDTDLDTFVSSHILKSVGYLTGCVLERDLSRRGVSIVPGPTGSSAHALAKLAVLEEDEAHKEPITAHTLKLQRAQKFQIGFHRIADVEEFPESFDGTLTRLLLSSFSPLSEKGKRSKAFIAIYHKYDVTHQRYNRRQKRNVKPTMPRSITQASTIFNNIDYRKMGDSSSVVIEEAPSLVRQGTDGPDVESWIEKVDTTSAPADDGQIVATREMNDARPRQHPTPSVNALEAGSRDPTTAPQPSTHQKSRPATSPTNQRFRPSTYAETPLETQSWAHVTPKHNNWNNPTDLTTSWSSYNKPMATSAQYPPLIKISNTQPTQTPAARTDMQYIAGARNTGRGGGTAPQRSAWGKPAHSNAQGAPHNARSNSQASPQTGHRRQQPELAQRGRNTSRSVASRGRGSRQAVNPAPRPTTQTNNPFAALQDSTESVDDTEDEREFIRTTLKAPAPAPSRKNSPKKKKSAKSSAAANLKAEYGLPPPTPVRLPVKKGLTPGPKKDFTSGSDSESSGNTSVDTTLASTYPSTAEAGSTASFFGLHADLEGLELGSRVSVNTKNAMSSIRQSLEYARSFRGEIEVRIQIGQVFLQKLPKDFRTELNEEMFVSTITEMDQSAFKKFEGAFTHLVTSSTTDTDCLLEIIGLQPSDHPYETNTTYNFGCERHDKSMITIVVGGDQEERESHLRSQQRLLGSWYAHHPQRVWDARMLVTGHASSELEDCIGAPEFVSRLHVQHQSDYPGPSMQGRDGNHGIELQNVQVHTTIRYRINMAVPSQQSISSEESTSDCYVEIKSVIDLPIYRPETSSSNPAETGEFRALCGSKAAMIAKHRLWYEVSFGFVTPPEAFSENATTLELGEKAAWTGEDVISEKSLLALHEIATKAVEKMDNIGARNVGRGAKEEKVRFDEEDEKRKRPDIFW